MKQSPSISVLIPSYNYARYISEAIQSVIAQSFVDWELIIIDDASTDGSLEICRRYEAQYPEKIRVIASPKNKGLPHSIALGARGSRGTYIAFLEADDTWDKEALGEKLAGDDSTWKKLLERDIDAHTRKLPSRTPIHPTSILHQNYIPTFSCVMTRRLALLEVDFDIPINAHNFDHWIWTQLAFTGTFIYIPEQLTVWRIHDRSYGFRSALENTKISAFTFSRNKTRYVKALAQIMARRPGNGAGIDFATLPSNYPSQSRGIIARVLYVIEEHRPSDNRIWKCLVLIKDLCWALRVK